MPYDQGEQLGEIKSANAVSTEIAILTSQLEAAFMKLAQAALTDCGERLFLDELNIRRMLQQLVAAPLISPGDWSAKAGLYRGLTDIVGVEQEDLRMFAHDLGVQLHDTAVRLS